MKKLKLFIISAFAALAIMPLLAPAGVATAANAKESLCEGIGLAGGGKNDCTQTAGDSTVDSVIGRAIDILSLVVGVISVIMIIIGGLKYIMSAGEGSNITAAKNTIIYAIVGLVIVAFAQIIVKFVLTKV